MGMFSRKGSTIEVRALRTTTDRDPKAAGPYAYGVLLPGDIRPLDEEWARVLEERGDVEIYKRPPGETLPEMVTVSAVASCRPRDVWGSLEPGELYDMPIERARQLEAQRKVKILRSPADREAHVKAWREHTERIRELREEMMRVRRQADEAAVAYQRALNGTPEIEWPSATAKKGGKAA